jgi:hypothetical protein
LLGIDFFELLYGTKSSKCKDNWNLYNISSSIRNAKVAASKENTQSGHIATTMKRGFRKPQCRVLLGIDSRELLYGTKFSKCKDIWNPCSISCSTLQFEMPKSQHPRIMYN